MKHIVGVTFIVENKRVQINGPLTSAQAKQLSKNRPNDNMPAGKYTLTNIRKREEQIHYTFKLNDTELIVLKFNSVKEADQLIDRYLR